MFAPSGSCAPWGEGSTPPCVSLHFDSLASTSGAKPLSVELSLAQISHLIVKRRFVTCLEPHSRARISVPSPTASDTVFHQPTPMASWDMQDR